MKAHGYALCALIVATKISFVAGDGYEVWASDQSNSAAGQTGLGVKGGFIWIYDSSSIQKPLRLKRSDDAVSLSCSPSAKTGPCNTLDMFPQNLSQSFANGTLTGRVLGDLPGFGRLHGVVRDPFNRYVNANFFAPNGGFVGIIDTETKEAVGLFQLTKIGFASTNTTGRGVHMSFWATDGSAIIMANIFGKAIERINVFRDASKKITGLFFDRSATLGLGKGMSVAEEGSFFVGSNAFGRPLMGGIVGDYADADLDDLTPNGHCKETGCNNPSALPMALGGRSNNQPICPIVSTKNNLYATLAGGGLLVADITTTPMSILGEYESSVVQGAGCGGVDANDKVFLNAGVAAGTVGLNESTFTLYAFQDTAFKCGSALPSNTPKPDVAFFDSANTLTGGNTVGTKSIDLSGQLPKSTTRRDSHGMIVTVGGSYVHVMDRIQNTIEVFDSAKYKHTTYDTTTYSGRPSSASGQFWLKWMDRMFDGPCVAASINDDPGLPRNDPAPDLSEPTPDGKFVMVALRGPLPVSVAHGSQGSCPGIGVVKLSGDGKDGRLVQVIRTTNTLPDAVTIGPLTVPGGHPYAGKERSDVHAVIVVSK
jgi:hypothetical protein